MLQKQLDFAPRHALTGDQAQILRTDTEDIGVVSLETSPVHTNCTPTLSAPKPATRAVGQKTWERLIIAGRSSKADARNASK